MAKRIVPLIINGAKILRDDPEMLIPVHSTGTHQEVLHYAQAATIDDVVAAARGSMAAFRGWKNTAPLERRDILLAGAENLMKTRSEGIDLSVAEWSPDKGFATKMYDDAIRHIQHWASLIPTSFVARSPVSESPSTSFPLVFNEPLGPVLGIAPWNAASILSARSFGTPLAAGCTAVFKTSEHSPATHAHMAQCMIDGGLPDGVLNVLHMRSADAQALVAALVSTPEIAKVNFTGSTRTGRQLAITAAENLKPILLELGGKAASIILPDADLAKAAHMCVLGAFMNQGQICMSTERVYVHAKVYEEFIQLVRQAAMGWPEVALPQITAEHAAHVHKLVKQAVEHGARLVYGTLEGCGGAAATTMDERVARRTILADVGVHAAVYAEESFGPTMVICKVESAAEAVERTNESRYGLSASIWTKDVVRGVLLAREIESGAVHINGMTVHDESTLPHGGVKESGYGRFGAQWGLLEFMTTKTVTIGVDQITEFK
ncbi:aldehyde dehydrogenase domain-containing protein [Limtongia smithiae]|uniref:aldehyde dehydrogenase domain-containing protein n=1 Tax=Limtongia smithiae TaxID=1125753 RepID=UPI0034CF68AB